MEKDNVYVRSIPIYSLAYMEVGVPDIVMRPLREETDKMIKSDFKTAEGHNKNLAGNIEREFYVKDTYPLLNSFIEQVTPEFWDYYLNNNLKNKKHSISISPDRKPALWVNFQKKGEFNPIHSHSGDLSFVIFVNLPYTYEDECLSPSCKNSNEPVPGCFEFLYVNQFNYGLGKHPLKTDRSFENKMIVFNSRLHHQVYPFYTSDEYRITVAGNITIA